MMKFLALLLLTLLGDSNGTNPLSGNVIRNGDELIIDHYSEDLDNELEESYRLPEDVEPLSYDLRLVPFLEEGNFTFKGYVNIMINVKQVTNKITLHAKKLNIYEEKVLEHWTGYEIEIECSSNEEKTDFHIIHLKKPLEMHKIYSIVMKFEGKLNHNLEGFYKAAYTDENGNKRWMAVTHFEATSARNSFPCFDEPHLKARFAISLARNEEMSTISNMGQIGSPESDPELPPNYVWDHYQTTPKMSTYLVAFIFSDFKYKSTDSGRFKVWAKKESIDQVDYSLELGPKILDVMCNITNIKFALPKMDMIAVPEFEAGAMENWGLVTFRETALLYEEGTSTANNLQRVATVVAHELAHQWFGNLVSPEWWQFTWLNEGFATFFECTATDVVEPTWRLTEQFVIKHLQYALLIDAYQSTHPITTDLETPDEISSVFDEISYSKAGSVIRMMAHSLTNNTFYRGLERYLLARQYKSGSDVQLFEGLDAQAKEDGALPQGVTVADIMMTWTKQVGFPVITIERNYDAGHAHVTQERFVLGEASRGNHRWWIPLTFTSRSAANFTNTVPSTWMPACEKTIVVSGMPKGDEWVIFNLQQAGFYRVNYDARNWKMIIDYLNGEDFEKVHPVNRAQLTDDALNLARSGELHYNTALDLISYLDKETDLIPWLAAYQGLGYLEARLAGSPPFPKFAKMVLDLLRAQYDRVQFNGSPNDDHIARLTRLNLLPWACKYNHPDCLKEAKKMFAEWKQNPEFSVPSSLKDTVYCYGVSSGSEEDWEFLWEKYKSSKVATEEMIILHSLGCTNDEKIMKRYLQESIAEDSKIRKQDRSYAMSAVSRRYQGQDIAVEFFVENFDKIKASYTTKSVASLIKSISSRVSSTKNYEMMKQLLTSREGTLGSAERAAEQALQSMDYNMNWNERYVPVIESWFKEKYPNC
ncbi:aminopeptidase N-like [Ischnura elegans]|uniref:aminopeptidase N-like n=1 Tax=Ischnura elegans TaxID=197161 RepID=UPI001ED8827A|nr:aminopeptidase N-like [Ischnura elegans]